MASWETWQGFYHVNALFYCMKFQKFEPLSFDHVICVSFQTLCGRDKTSLKDELTFLVILSCLYTSLAWPTSNAESWTSKDQCVFRHDSGELYWAPHWGVYREITEQYLTALPTHSICFWLNCGGNACKLLCYVWTTTVS